MRKGGFDSPSRSKSYEISEKSNKSHKYSALASFHYVYPFSRISLVPDRNRHQIDTKMSAGIAAKVGEEDPSTSMVICGSPILAGSNGGVRSTPALSLQAAQCNSTIGPREKQSQLFDTTPHLSFMV